MATTSAGSKQALKYGEKLDDQRRDVFAASRPDTCWVRRKRRRSAAARAIVVSGDYKRQPDPTCAPFEVSSATCSSSEATFALPVFKHPSAEAEVRKLLSSVAMFPERTHLVGAYALGKAQRVMALLRAVRLG